MKTTVVVLAGGAGTRLGVLTAKRTKPAVPFAGKYRIIDFALSNCVNSNLYDLTIIAQYRPHSLIAHIGAGGPWDLNREFSGGIRVFTPYKARSTDWFAGTADAIQQNFVFIKRNDPDLILILSGDHVYSMDYQKMINFHIEREADLTIATHEVPIEEASRYGIIDIDKNQRVTSFLEKPEKPPSNLINMGVYIFNRRLLDKALWDDHLHQDSQHDFGKNVIPALLNSNSNIYAYPFTGYWVDVGTIESYLQSHMDLLGAPPSFDLYDRSWIIHTRTEERPPVNIHAGAVIEDSTICDGSIIEENTRITRCVISPGVRVKSGSVIEGSIILTDTVINNDTTIERAILDKRIIIGNGCKIGGKMKENKSIAMVGRHTILPPGTIIDAGGTVGPDVIPEDLTDSFVRSGEYIQTRRLPNEI